ncbi:Zinc finger RanBP2-type [Trinorchestia longiramus]|nr:Zinc finger RanBP2-type [Trinorchestia longiramus]
MKEEEVSCGSKVAGIGGPEGGEGRPSRADHKGDQLTGQGHVSRPTSLALSCSNGPRLTCERWLSSSAVSSAATSAATANPPSSCLPVCSVLPQHNTTAVLASVSQYATNLQNGICTVALTPVTPTITHSPVPSISIAGITSPCFPNHSVSLAIPTLPTTLLTPTTLSPSTPNSKCGNTSIGSSQAITSYGVASFPLPLETSFSLQNQRSIVCPISNEYPLSHPPTVNHATYFNNTSTFWDIPSLSMGIPGVGVGTHVGPKPSVPLAYHILGQQQHPDFSTNDISSNVNNTILPQHNFVLPSNTDSLRITSEEGSHLLTPVSNPLGFPFTPVSSASNNRFATVDYVRLIPVENYCPSSSVVPKNDKNISPFVHTTSSTGSNPVEQQPVAGEVSHMRSNSLPLFKSTIGNAGHLASTLPRSPSYPGPGGNSASLSNTSSSNTSLKPIRIQRKLGFFFQGEVPRLASPALNDDSMPAVERNDSTNVLNVDLKLTLPASPPPVDSGDESVYSWQGHETVSIKDSDVEDSFEEFEPQAATDSRPHNDRLELLFLPNIDLMSSDSNASIIIDQEPIYDEYEPASDHDQNDPVCEYSDSEIDASYAVAAIAALSSDMEAFADQSAMDSDAADTDELDMPAFFIARNQKEARRRNKMNNCDLSSVHSESDPDFHDDRWKCLECNQANNRSFFRYCEKCWKMRRCWLPDPPKKRKKKKPRHRPRKRRSTDKAAASAARTASAGTTDAGSGAVQADQALSDVLGATDVTGTGNIGEAAGFTGEVGITNKAIDISQANTDRSQCTSDGQSISCRGGDSASCCNKKETIDTLGETSACHSAGSGIDTVEAKCAASEANTAALSCSSGEGSFSVGGASSAAAERQSTPEILKSSVTSHSLEGNVLCGDKSSTCERDHDSPDSLSEDEWMENEIDVVNVASDYKESNGTRKSLERESNVRDTKCRSPVEPASVHTSSLVTHRKENKDSVSSDASVNEELECEIKGMDVVDSGELTLTRCSSTASTVILDHDESYLDHLPQDRNEELMDPASADAETSDTKSLLRKLLEENLTTVRNSIDSIDCHYESSNSPHSAEKSETLVAGAHNPLQQQPNLTDACADLDRCSTVSGADSLPSVVDSGLGSSQDLFQESSLDVPAQLSADANSYGSAIVFTSPSKRESPYKEFEDLKAERRRRSNSAGPRIGIIDFVIEKVKDETSPQRSSDRGNKRKCSILDSGARKKKKQSAHDPTAKYLNEGLMLIDETTDVQKLAESNTVRVISESIVQFLRSESGWEWMSSDRGRSWMSSAPVQSMLHESLRRSTDSVQSSSSVFGDNLCIMCQDRPKDAVIIHGKISHQATCYQCAKTISDRKQRCPVCRRKILRIAKNIIA